LIFTYSILTKNKEDNKAVIEKFHSEYNEKHYSDFDDTES